MGELLLRKQYVYGKGKPSNKIRIDIKEMKAIASDIVDSIMRGQSIKSAKNFSLKKVITKLEAYAPCSIRSYTK